MYGCVSSRLSDRYPNCISMIFVGRWYTDSSHRTPPYGCAHQVLDSCHRYRACHLWRCVIMCDGYATHGRKVLASCVYCQIFHNVQKTMVSTHSSLDSSTGNSSLIAHGQNAASQSATIIVKSDTTSSSSCVRTCTAA